MCVGLVGWESYVRKLVLRDSLERSASRGVTVSTVRVATT